MLIRHTTVECETKAKPCVISVEVRLVAKPRLASKMGVRCTASALTEPLFVVVAVGYSWETAMESQIQMWNHTTVDKQKT